MQGIPLDVLRYIAKTFLSDRDRLRLAQANRRCHAVARLDASPVVFDAILDVRDREGFRQSPNGYWHPLPLPSFDMNPQHLGMMAATDPWAFVKRWMTIPKEIKSLEFRQDCVDGFTLHTTAWNPDVVAALTVMLRCMHPDCNVLCARLLSTSAHQLLRRAVWYGRKDVLCFLLDKGNMDADVGEGAPLRLTIGTLGYEHTEDEVAEIVYELLERGADPLRNNLWGIRLCLQRNFYVVAALLSMYAAKRSEGRTKLLELVHDLYLTGHAEQAFLVKTSMEDAHDFFCLCV